MKEIEEKIGNYIVEYSNMEPEDVEDTYAVVANHEVTPEVYEACMRQLRCTKVVIWISLKRRMSGIMS